MNSNSGEENVSPLSEADPNSLDELFERVNAKLVAGMPEAISDVDDLMPMVNILRNQRKVFLAEQDKIGRAPRTVKRKPAPQSVSEVIQNIDVSELD